jgi:hypothetical protein
MMSSGKEPETLPLGIELATAVPFAVKIPALDTPTSAL